MFYITAYFVRSRTVHVDVLTTYMDTIVLLTDRSPLHRLYSLDMLHVSQSEAAKKN